MRITISTTPQRKQPHPGDLRTTKKHGLQVRVPTPWPEGRMLRPGGRLRFEWVSPTEACLIGYAHLVPEEHRPPVDPYPAGYMQQRGAA